MNLFSQFKSATPSFWIPFKVDKQDKTIGEFSHKDFTGLFFSETPTLWTLKKRFNSIVYNDTVPGLTFIENLWKRSSSLQRELLYRNFIKELKANLKSNEKQGFFGRLTNIDDVATRAELYINLLNRLYLEKSIDSSMHDNVKKNSSLQPAQWIGKPVELTELIDALYISGKLPGATQKQLIECFNFIFNVNLEYDKFTDAQQSIKKRKKDKAKFLISLTENYSNKINEDDK